MESNQLNNTTNEDAVIELLTLNCKIDNFGTKKYYNKDGKLHRIHGPAISWPNGTKFWYRNGMLHREDGPAINWNDGRKECWIDDQQISKEDFIQWQKEHGIDPIK